MKKKGKLNYQYPVLQERVYIGSPKPIAKLKRARLNVLGNYNNNAVCHIITNPTPTIEPHPIPKKI